MKQLTYIDKTHQVMKLITFSVLLLSFLFSGFVYFKTEQRSAEERKKIYILDNGNVLKLAHSDNIKNNLPAEIKSHISDFIRLFYTFEPDPKDIKETIEAALYLADNSARALHYNREEERYYHKIVDGSISTRVKVDEIKITNKQEPYICEITYRYKIIRATKEVMNKYVAKCQIRSTKRTDNNPHGLMIERFTTKKPELIYERKR